MPDHPMLFKAPMIRALLAGTKTQTRRVIKPQPTVHLNGAWSWKGRNGGFVGAAGTHVDEGFPESAKDWNRIQPGDRLFVREAWQSDVACSTFKPRDIPHGERIFFRAGGSTNTTNLSVCAMGWRPGIHMPRWASRLTLIVTEVRVQRLHDISEEDALAEGVEDGGCLNCGGSSLASEGCCYAPAPSYRESYAALWNSINGPGSWNENPWVAAYTFTVHQQNIDALEERKALAEGETP